MKRILIAIVLFAMAGLTQAQTTMTLEQMLQQISQLQAQLNQLGPQAAGDTTQINFGMFDARNYGRAFLSHEMTVDYQGSYNYPLQLVDGNKTNVSGQFQARYYYVNGARVFKFYQYSIQYGHGTIVQYAGEPFEVFPYPTKGTPGGINIYINGFDAKGMCACYGQYASQSWKPGDSFMFYTTPGQVPMTIKFDLAGRDPNSVGLFIDGWEGSPIVYNAGQGGFTIWVDPMQQYSGRIVNLWNNNATIIPLTPFNYRSLPNTTPTGSATGFYFAGGVQDVAFDVNNTYCPGMCYFNTSIPEKDVYVPASVYMVQAAELQGAGATLSIGNFAGRVQVEVFTGTAGKIYLNQEWNKPAENLQVEIPEGYSSVMITVIKENVPVTIPIGRTWNSDQYWIVIGRYSIGKG